MLQPLYFTQNPPGSAGAEILNSGAEGLICLGLDPPNPTDPPATKPVSLKSGLHWHSPAALAKVMGSMDSWPGFPEPDLTLITAEVRTGDAEPLRIDLLYLNPNGGIIPVVLKVGGTDLDTHGQVIRQMAGLRMQVLSRDWVMDQRKQFLQRLHDVQGEDGGGPPQEKALAEGLEAFQAKISGIPENDFYLVPGRGILLDEAFPEPLMSAARFLNNEINMALRLIRLEAFVDEDWQPEGGACSVRLEMTDVFK